MNKTIKEKRKEATEMWLAQKCTEIEKLQMKHDLYNLPKKIKEMTNRNKKVTACVLRDNNVILIDIKSKLKLWICRKLV